MLGPPLLIFCANEIGIHKIFYTIMNEWGIFVDHTNQFAGSFMKMHCALNYILTNKFVFQSWAGSGRVNTHY